MNVSRLCGVSVTVDWTPQCARSVPRSVGLCQSAAPKWLIAFVNADEAVIVIDLWSLSGHSLVSVNDALSTWPRSRFWANIALQCCWVDERHWTSLPSQMWHSDISIATDTRVTIGDGLCRMLFYPAALPSFIVRRGLDFGLIIWL